MSTLAAARADNFYYPKNWDPSKVTTLLDQNNLSSFREVSINTINPIPWELEQAKSKKESLLFGIHQPNNRLILLVSKFLSMFVAQNVKI